MNTMIFDGHVHLWSHDEARYPSVPWTLTGGGKLPNEDGTGERLVGPMDVAGVVGALNVQVPWYMEDCRFAKRTIEAACRHLVAAPHRRRLFTRAEPSRNGYSGQPPNLIGVCL